MTVVGSGYWISAHISRNSILVLFIPLRVSRDPVMWIAHTSIMVRRSLTFIRANVFGSSIPSSSILAIRHVLEQKTLSGFCDRKTVFKHAYPSRPKSSVKIDRHFYPDTHP
jgi:hypothetical protein